MGLKNANLRVKGSRRCLSLWFALFIFSSAIVFIHWQSEFLPAPFSYVSVKYFGNTSTIVGEFFEHIAVNTSEIANVTTTILMWTEWFGRPVEEALIKECREQNCVLTNDRSLLSHADAVVFHIRDLNWSDIPRERSAYQNYVFFNWESPYHTGDDFSEDWKRWYFNSTMTYRRDSDVYAPYGNIVKRRSPLRVDLKRLVRNKTKPVAWLVSNCRTPSEREAVVEELQKYIPVDIYGACGNHTCRKDNDSRFDPGSCGQIFEQNYKLYLAFENSLCKDYVTEKIFLRLWRYVVPVVLQRKNYEHFCPEYKKPWFIAADDFWSVQEMAKSLENLHRNATAYYEYLSWHEHYETVVRSNSDNGVVTKNHWCDLCRFETKRKQRMAIRNVFDWWYKDACQKAVF